MAIAQLNLNLDFTAFMAGPTGPNSVSDILKNDSWTAATTDTEKLNAAKAVMETAASMLEGAFSNCSDVSLTHTINVGWDGHLASSDFVLATGGTSWSSSAPFQLGTGSLNWDDENNGATTNMFFVDLTPNDNTEFTASANDTRTADFGGTNINIEDRWYANFLGTDAADNADMLSTAIHEMMHAVGVLSSYPNYTALDIGSDNDLDLMAAGATYEVLYNGGHTIESLPWDGPGSLGGGTYYPNVIGPANISGTRGLLTDVDVLALSKLHGWGQGPGNEYLCVNQPHGTVPVPEPAFGYLIFGSVCLLAMARRRG